MTEEFTLREWRLSDKISLAANADNINVWNCVRDYFPHPYTVRDGEEFITMVGNRIGPTVDFAIEIDGAAVGGIGIVLKLDVERVAAEIGYWLGEKYWNRGIMTGAIKKMAEYSFMTFQIEKLYATVFDFNIASQRVLEKAGFEKEAVLKRAAIKSNRVMDLHYYGFLRTE